MTQITTDQQYDEVITRCRDIFLKKTKDYGTAWRVYRLISVADQLYIKAKRIRNIQDGIVAKIGDSISEEFSGIINYSVIGLMQLEIEGDEWDLSVEKVSEVYNRVIGRAMQLMKEKNNDYGEAWRDMDLRSLTDLILAKVLRIKQIIQNDGKTVISEGIDSNLYDILNYGVFALILIGEQESQQSTI